MMIHKKIQGIQNLRGICVLLTVFAHLPLATMPFALANLPAPYLIGVSIFYGISGWIIAFVTDDLTPRAIGDFYCKRYFRIAPILYCSLLVSLVLSWLLPHNRIVDQFYPGLPAVLSNIYQNVTFTVDLPGPYSAPLSLLGLWSVSVEVQFYAIYGLLLLLSRRLRMVALCLLLAGLVVLRWNYVAQMNPIGYSHAFYLELFALGALSYHVKQLRFDRKLISYLAWTWIFVFPCLELKGKPFLLGYYAMCLAVIYVVNYMVRLQLKTTRLNAAFTWLGERSYVLYIFHFQFLAIAGLFGQVHHYNVRHTWEYHLVLVAGLLIGLPITNFLHQTIEKGGIRLGKRVSNWLAFTSQPTVIRLEKTTESAG